MTAGECVRVSMCDVRGLRLSETRRDGADRDGPAWLERHGCRSWGDGPANGKGGNRGLRLHGWMDGCPWPKPGKDLYVLTSTLHASRGGRERESMCVCMCVYGQARTATSDDW